MLLTYAVLRTWARGCIFHRASCAGLGKKRCGDDEDVQCGVGSESCDIRIIILAIIRASILTFYLSICN